MDSRVKPSDKRKYPVYEEKIQHSSDESKSSFLDSFKKIRRGMRVSKEANPRPITQEEMKIISNYNIATQYKSSMPSPVTKVVIRNKNIDKQDLNGKFLPPSYSTNFVPEGNNVTQEAQSESETDNQIPQEEAETPISENLSDSSDAGQGQTRVDKTEESPNVNEGNVSYLGVHRGVVLEAEGANIKKKKIKVYTSSFEHPRKTFVLW